MADSPASLCCADAPETKTDKHKHAIGVAIRYYPGEYRLEEEFVEFLIEDRSYLSVWQIKEKIAAATRDVLPESRMVGSTTNGPFSAFRCVFTVPVACFLCLLFADEAVAIVGGVLTVHDQAAVRPETDRHRR